MFNFFKRPDYQHTAKEIPSIPYIEPQKSVPETYYTIGVTSDNRIAIQIGYSTLTVNRQGIENLIQQLSVFRDQLAKEETT